MTVHSTKNVWCKLIIRVNRVFIVSRIQTATMQEYMAFIYGAKCSLNKKKICINICHSILRASQRII